jgi:glycosidase
MWGGNDPDDRIPMVWEDMKFEPQAIDPRGRERSPDDVNFDRQLFQFYKDAIHLRRAHEALNYGDFQVLAADNEQHSFASSRSVAGETLVVVLNRGTAEARIRVPIPADSLQPLFVTEGNTSSVNVNEEDDNAVVVLPPLTGAVLSVKSR